jgi:hypothetical protein
MRFWSQSIDLDSICFSEYACLPTFKVNWWYWRSLWRYTLILTNFTDAAISPSPFHRSKRYGEYTQVCNQSKAICMLSTPPKSEPNCWTESAVPNLWTAYIISFPLLVQAQMRISPTWNFCITVSSCKDCCLAASNHNQYRSSSHWNSPSYWVTISPNYCETVWQPARDVAAARNLDVSWLFFVLFFHCLFGRFSSGKIYLC